MRRFVYTLGDKETWVNAASVEFGAGHVVWRDDVGRVVLAVAVELVDTVREVSGRAS